MVPRKTNSNWLSLKLRERRANEAQKEKAKLAEEQDSRFLRYVRVCRGSEEFEPIIESGYLCHYPSEKIPEAVQSAINKFDFPSPTDFFSGLRRWVQTDPQLFEALEAKRLLKRQAFEAEKLRKAEELLAAREEQMEKRKAELEENARLLKIRETERIDAIRDAYLSNKQMMIDEARIYRDLMEKHEQCKRASSRRKWKKELMHNNFALFLRAGKANQDEYKKVFITGVFDRKGIDFNSPGQIYLMKNQSLNALKIGIMSTSSISDRVSIHQSKGWELISKWEMASTWHAYSVEQQIICWWRDELELGNGAHPNQMPQGGFSETAPNSDELAITTLTQIEQFLSQPAARARKPRTGNGIQVEIGDDKCWCGGKWVKRVNKTSYGKFYSCSRWPYCLNRPDRFK
jgi:hypothetical protein